MVPGRNGVSPARKIPERKVRLKMRNGPQKILCVTANPCVDKVIWYRETPDYPTRVFYQLGGKGVNAARMLGWLGYRVVSLTFGGDRERTLADREPCRTILVPVCHPVREIPLTVNREEGKAQLHFENTNRVTAPEARLFLEAFRKELSGQPELVIISGGACAGTEELFPAMVRLAKAAQLPVMLDSHGPCFLSSLPEGPDYVKPNREELEQAVGPVPPGEEQAAAHRLMALGAGCVLLTMGEQGAFCITGEETVFCPPFRVPVVSAIGCGDAFTAYFAHGLLQGWPLKRCIEAGSAAGAANAMQAVSGRVREKQIRRIWKRFGLSGPERTDIIS